MKKLLLILMLMSGSVFAQNVKVATPANPSQNIITGVTINNSTNVVIPGDFSLTKGAANNFIWTCTNANGAGAWLVNSGTNSIPGSVVLTNNTLFANAITNVTSVGAGESLRNAVSNNVFFIKSLLAGSGITIIDEGTNLTVSTTGAGSSTLLSTNITGATGGAGSVWSTILELPTTATTGTVVVWANAAHKGAGTDFSIRLRDATTNVVAQINQFDGSNILDRWSFHATLIDSLAGVTKTYYLDVQSNVGSAVWTNSFTGQTYGPPVVNEGINIKILQIP